MTTRKLSQENQEQYQGEVDLEKFTDRQYTLAIVFYIGYEFKKQRIHFIGGVPRKGDWKNKFTILLFLNIHCE